MDDNYNEIPRNPFAFAMAALLCGVLGTALVFTSEVYIASVIMGAAGMFVGGFAISLSNRNTSRDRIQYMLLAGAGIMTSVISFMFGFVYWLG